MKSVFVFFSCLFLLVANTSRADVGCSESARSELEQLFCTIKRSAAGASLPSFRDFRRNGPKVQLMLLKRPAEQLGLPLPDLASNAPESPAVKAAPAPQQPQAEKRSPTFPLSVNLQAAASRAEADPQADKAKPEAQAQAADRLVGCQLRHSEIRCAGRHYVLLGNQGNDLLDPDALSADKVLGLERYRGDVDDEAAVNNYLAQSYRRYIKKMLGIGLGGATMSYTKFYYIFQDATKNNKDFAARFETMFGYLKKDKAAMAVSAHYSQRRPTSIEQCAELSDQLVVCDNTTTNWVFVAP